MKLDGYRLLSCCLLSLWALGTTTCQLVVDPEALQRGCAPSQKACDGRCVERSDPEYGCGNASCQPCVLPNATSVCDAQFDCAVAACVGNYEDCDADPSTGCEVNLDTDVDHCGSCTAEPCQVFGALPACARGACAIRKCQPGHKDCNRLDEDGCEFFLDPEEAGLAAPDAGATLQCPDPGLAGQQGLVDCRDAGCITDAAAAGAGALATPAVPFAQNVEAAAPRPTHNH